MKHRIILVSIAVFLGVVAWLTIFLKNPGSNGLCINDFVCEDFWNFGVRLPIYYGMQYLVGILFIMAILPINFIKIWLRIFIPALILSLLMVLSSPTDCSAPLMLCFNKLNLTQGLGKVLLILTLLIILTKSLYLWFISYRHKKLSK